MKSVEFKIGDVVVFNSSDVQMTIIKDVGATDIIINCGWFNINNEYITEIFRKETIKHYVDPFNWNH